MLYSSGEEELMKLLLGVQDSLLDLMSTFYIETSKYCDETEKFETISAIRVKLEDIWEKKQLERF